MAKQKVLIIWSAVFVVYGFIFYYLPLGGWVMAFQDYKNKTGLLHSRWIKHSGILFDPQTKKSKTVIAPVEYFDVPLIKYIVRSNRI